MGLSWKILEAGALSAVLLQLNEERGLLQGKKEHLVSTNCMPGLVPYEICAVIPILQMNKPRLHKHICSVRVLSHSLLYRKASTCIHAKLL